MQEHRALFPVLTQSIYANTASCGPLSQPLQEWRQEHDLDFLIGGSTMKMESYGIISETKHVVSDFFGGTKSRVALIQNWSLGLNILLEGLDRNTKVLLLQSDYPSVNWPFESRGFSISYVPIGEHLEEHIMNKVKEEGIGVLALSLVQWLDGFTIDMNFLKELKAAFPELIIIADGTQYCGAFDIDFEESGIDVLGTSGYKWLLAGFGNGCMLFSPGVAEKFKVKTTGFNAAGIDLTAGKNFRFSKHFEPGHLDTFNFGSLKLAIQLLQQIGIGAIEAYNQKLAEKAKKGFTDLGLLSDVVVKRKQHSTIFNIKGNDQTFELLVNNNVVCTRRGDGIRLSFHFYNTEWEIDHITELLKFKR
ncbi:MAG TPA: aminotransferase class V-fold PLP-dependent enzyme [Eudoraea sp.]|nr:aminotransferase class V-fold PLP-dependent enzyme [Eudoraea sp.]